MPPDPSLAGAGFAAQGVLVDLNSGRAIALNFTNGVLITVRP